MDVPGSVLRSTFSGGLTLALAAWAATAAALPPPADVRKDTGVTAGLAVVVGTTDGALEAGLTNGGKMLVQGLALSDEAAAKARRHIFDQKLYGLASVSVVSSPATLPYYDRLVNLLVADLDALGKDAPSREEIDRVLGYEGVAYLKHGGKWAKTVKPTPAEVDSWGHYMYDASRNSVSKDRLVAPPNALRWFGGPTGRNPIGGPRTSDGVFVQISNPYRHGSPGRGSGKTLPWAPVDNVALWAKDVNSGVMLWHRVLSRLPARGYMRTSGYAMDFSEAFVAADGRVYVYDFAHDDQVALTAFNLRTGAVERVFDKSVVFRRADIPPPADPKARNPDWRTGAYETFADTTVLVHGGKVVQALWDKLFVMDAASGDVLWKKDVPAKQSLAHTLVAGDRLIAVLTEPPPERFARGVGVPYVAIEAWQIKDGKPLWRFTDLEGTLWRQDHRRCNGFGSRDHYLLVPGGREKKGNSLLLLDVRDGSRIWERTVGMEMWTWAMLGEQIWSCRGSSGGVLDLATGKNLFNLGMPNTGNCSVGGGTANYFIQKKVFFPVAEGGSRGQRGSAFYYLRTVTQTCGENLCPSYGSVYNMPPVCKCEMALSGTQAWYALRPTTPLADDQRLDKQGGPPLTAVDRQAEALKFPGAFDWGLPDAYQGIFWRTDRRGGKDGSVWRGYGLTQTDPVTAGDLSLVAHVQEHRLAASRDGKQVWNFVAGGRIGTPPVVHQDLAIFGCHDGCVYAVRVKDGSLAWRFLAAPADRRHVVMNQVESVWPVYGVALHEGKLYFSAGKHAELDGGVHFYCLDPSTGAMKWHVKRLCGLSSDKYTPRKIVKDAAGKDYDPERNKRFINDVVEVRDGKLWLFEQELVDLADPQDSIVNPETLVPPGMGAAVGPEQVPALIKALAERDLAARLQAAMLLGEAGAVAADALPALRGAVGDREAVMRRVAARAIGRIGRIEPALAELGKALCDPDEDVREAAGDALGRGGKSAVPVLVELLGNGDLAVARAAARSVGMIGPEAGPQAVPGLLRLMRADADDCQRRHAAKAAASREAAITQELRSNVVVEALSQLGPAAAEPVAALLDGADDATFRFALAVLDRLGPQARAVAPAVLKVFRETAGDPRKTRAAVVLGRLGADDDAIVAALGEGLRHDEEPVRQRCAEALAKLGEKGAQALSKVKLDK